MYTTFYEKPPKERFYFVYRGVCTRIMLKCSKKIGRECTNWIRVVGVAIQWPGVVNMAVILPTP
jgi:hypothetical protein